MKKMLLNRVFGKIQLVAAFLSLFPFIVFPQDSIKNYSGIPIITYDYLIFQHNPPPSNSDMKNMDSAGIFAAEITNMQTSYYNNYLNQTNLKILPDQIDGTANNYINRYTDAYYTVWQAEGTNPADGDATLYYKSNVGEKVTGAVRTKANQGIQNDTLIYGPYYRQENKYVMVDNDQTIFYRADFRLKKENIIGQPPPQPSDIICILQVTSSELREAWVLDPTYIIDSLVVRYSDLADTFKTFSINYNLNTVSENYRTLKVSKSVSYSAAERKAESYFREFTEYVQFKVLWKGNSNKLRLYVDKITISDQRGRDLMNPNLTPSVAQLVSEQINEFQDRVTGWMGIDEPLCLDTYEPIRIVQNIIDSISNGQKSLWIAYGGNWSGRWDNWANPFGTYKLPFFEEFYKRVKKANIWCSKYLYDVSYDSTYPNYKELNIATLDSNYSHFQNKSNVFWGAAVQTGAYHIPEFSWINMREINGNELLYNINIALMYGAKVITLWPYFTGADGATALVNIHNVPWQYTEKWYKLKEVIAPRLRGVFGQTLKSLNEQSQYVNINVVSGQTLNYSFINKIEAVPSSGTYAADLGFFTDPNDANKKYFMTINHYYSTLTGTKFTFRNLNTYKNWEITNFVTGNKSTILATSNNAIYTENIPVGDAGLYSLLPVVKYGGKLQFNETISGTNSLLVEMTIESGAILTVNGTYNIYKTINVQGGGGITVNPGAKLNFYDGARLNIEGGSFTAIGLPYNMITFDFINKTSGIEFYAGSGTLRYCNIRNAGTAIFTYTSSPTVQFCNITNNNYGFNLGYMGGTNAISNNTISTNTVAGIRLYSSTPQNIYSNTITGNGDGIRCEVGSNARIFSNTISNNNNGIYIYYSAPQISQNIMRDNYSNGIYGEASNLSPLIKDNEIKKINTNKYNYQGIWLVNHSNPFITGNDIQGYYWGIYYGGGGTAYFMDLDYTTPFTNNRLLDNRTSLGVTYSSTAVAGADILGEGSFNTIDGNTYDANVYQNGIVYAMSNYWGSDGIQAITSSGGYINTLHPLNYDPWGNSLLAETGETDNGHSDQKTDPILLSINMEREGRIDEAIDLYKKMINENIFTAYALSSLARIENKFSKTEINNYLENYAAEKTEYRAEALSLLAGLKLNKGEYDEGMNLYDIIIGEENDSYLGINAGFEKFFAALHVKKDRELAGKLLSEIQNFKNTEDIFLARKEAAEYLLGSENPGISVLQKNNSKIIKNVLPEEYKLLGNNPNPFNPSTTINYTLPYQSSVELVIYDIMGRIIRSFSVHSQSAGYQNILWDGRNENGENVSSGVYLYLIKMHSLENGEEFVKAAKLMMVK